MRMLAMRSSPKTADLLYTAAMNKKITESQILQEFEKREGFFLHKRFDFGEKLPWDDYLLYDRDRLQKIAGKFRNERTNADDSTTATG